MNPSIRIVMAVELRRRRRAAGDARLIVPASACGRERLGGALAKRDISAWRKPLRSRMVRDFDASQLLGNLNEHLLQGTGHLVARATRAATLFGLVVRAKLGFAARMGAFRHYRG